MNNHNLSALLNETQVNVWRKGNKDVAYESLDYLCMIDIFL